ncbi:hypothetical protein CMI48_02290 [Candidatus Pacearchaeota archaeon]|jgi:FtsH-binding integral membrane protein|nr:hypothetical protein [Candidatus Pacearchaeota archaeon]|tara:strand:- start:41 stop:274 length:234 start_codon:yes stop_codon:yes gene_type:complete
MLVELLVLVLGIPVGLLLAWLCRDELAAGRKYLQWLLVGCVVVGVAFLFSDVWEFGLVLLFVAVLGGVSINKHLYDL